MFIQLLFLYLLLMNLAGFVSMGRDKHKAAAHLFRTPERRLLAYAALGGSLGSLFGMLAFRHKTKHLKFVVGVPLILIVQLLLVMAAVLYL